MDELRALWDFADLDATEVRFRALLHENPPAARRAEALTQLARIEALRGRFDEGEELLDEADRLAGTTPVVAVRVQLERGRLLRSSGDPAAALPLFESAFDGALAAGADFLAGDAAHMAALASDRDGMAAWTDRGLELAERSAAARYWAGPLLNNLGWAHLEAGEYEAALAAFRRALEAREREDDAVEARVARYCVAKALRALGRGDEAAAILEEVAEEARRDGHPDPYFDEELAEVRAELERR